MNIINERDTSAGRSASSGAGLTDEHVHSVDAVRPFSKPPASAQHADTEQLCAQGVAQLGAPASRYSFVEQLLWTTVARSELVHSRMVHTGKARPVRAVLQKAHSHASCGASGSVPRRLIPRGNARPVDCAAERWARRVPWCQLGTCCDRPAGVQTCRNCSTTNCQAALGPARAIRHRRQTAGRKLILRQLMRALFVSRK